MARKVSDRERVEEVFSRAEQSEAQHLLDIAGVIVRSRFPSKDAPAKRGRKVKPQSAPPISVTNSRAAEVAAK